MRFLRLDLPGMTGRIFCCSRKMFLDAGDEADAFFRYDAVGGARNCARAQAIGTVCEMISESWARCFILGVARYCKQHFLYFFRCRMGMDHYVWLCRADATPGCLARCDKLVQA